jgi:hypothetical protein
MTKSALQRPVFIMGSPRSGTTILYHVLYQTGHLNAVTALHLAYRDELTELRADPDLLQRRRAELRKWFQERGLADRGYDSVAIGPDMPEEYSYVLDDTGPTPRVSPKNIHLLLDFANKVQLLGSPNRPLLLKDPWDTNNFLTIRQFIPDARFVFIHRHPVPVISSLIKLFEALIQKPQEHEYDKLIDPVYRRFCQRRILAGLTRIVFSDSLPFLYQRLRRNVVQCCEYMTQHAAALGASATHLTYSDFCADPDRSVRRVLEFLELPRDFEGSFASLIRARDVRLNPRVERDRDRIEAQTRRYCETFGVEYA